MNKKFYAEVGDNNQRISTFSPGINFREMPGPIPDGEYLCAELEDTNDPDYGVKGRWVVGLKDSDAKIKGVLFSGVMCSATAEDQWGLSSIKEYVLAGNDTNYHFQNGNTLVLTSANWSDFEAIWIPFRQSFFPLPE